MQIHQPEVLPPYFVARKENPDFDLPDTEYNKISTGIYTPKLYNYIQEFLEKGIASCDDLIIRN
jgi:hypothetical protein